MKEGKNKIIYCSGIGGIGLSALALHYKKRGFEVYGSDLIRSVVTDDLENEGIKVDFSQDGQVLTDIIEANPDKEISFVYSNALDKKNGEMAMALDFESQGKLRIMNYPQALGDLIKGKVVIAVIGTHGKSTITSMIAKIFIESGHEVNLILGTRMKEIGDKNYIVHETSNLWLIEADEYKDAFLNYHPRYTILSACEPDHLDYFKTANNYFDSYSKLLSFMPENGVIVTHNELLENPAFGKRKIKAEIVTEKNLKYKEPTLKIPGTHNRKNARLALLFAQIFGIKEESASKSLANFSGIWRRFEILGNTSSGAIVVDDYAHNPAKVRGALQGAKEAYPDKRIIAVFEPHQANRVKTQLEDFKKSFDDADIVIIPDIYYVRDTDEDRKFITRDFFVNELAKVYPDKITIEIDLENLEDWINENTSKNDALIFMSAGPLSERAREMVK